MDPVLDIIERSNQRGGSMLSVIDLLEAGTFTARQLSRLIARIADGASWLVGARPGGAGKTTVMSALLGMLPAGEAIRLTNPGTRWEHSRPGECIVCYEISPGSYDAYIWGSDLQQLAKLAAAGCRIVTNLHADTLAQARDQIVGDNAVPECDFAAFDIFIPVSVRGGLMATQRVVEKIHYHENGRWRQLENHQPPSDRENEIQAFIERCRTDGLHLVADVRQAWLQRSASR